MRTQPFAFADTALPSGLKLFRSRAGAAEFEAALDLIRGNTLRHLKTPWGKAMSVAMTNCGELGWYSDATGYRYTAADPATGEKWAEMPLPLQTLAVATAAASGYSGFAPQACLVNFYNADARMGMHQDRDELALEQPVVSVSFGRAAVFRFGGLSRRDPARSFVLEHGDVVVFGGPQRLCYHGVARLTGPPHPILGESRINLTFRQVHRPT